MGRRLAWIGIVGVAAVWVLRPAGGDVLPRATAQSSLAEAAPADTSTATFAGGCFWCVEEVFEAVPGVLEAVSGYMGGRVENPSYEQVSAGRTGHAEAVRVRYDPARVGYGELLNVFWRNIDPTVRDRQFCDVGSQYRSAIFYHDDAQRAAAERTKQSVERQLGVPVHTQIVPASAFYVAEEYHQDYYRKNPLRYKFYKWNCGRAQRLEELWGAKEAAR